MARRDEDALEPRLELMPLLDVVFLLLTFFVYALAVMVQAEVVDFEMASVSGETAGGEAELVVLAIDREGRVELDGEAVGDAALDRRFRELAERGDDAPSVYLALEAEGPATQSAAGNTPGAVDRGPVVFDLIQRLQRAGVQRWAIVGAPGEGEVSESTDGGP